MAMWQRILVIVSVYVYLLSGGMLTSYIGAIDDRIHTSVISSYMGTWRMLRSTMCHHDAEQIWWGGTNQLQNK